MFLNARLPAELTPPRQKFALWALVYNTHIYILFRITFLDPGHPTLSKLNYIPDWSSWVQLGSLGSNLLHFFDLILNFKIQKSKFGKIFQKRLSSIHLTNNLTILSLIKESLVS